MIWGVIIGTAIGAILMIVALVIWAGTSDAPTYGDGYEAGQRDAQGQAEVVIRGLVEKQHVHEMAFDARKEIIRAVIESYGDTRNNSF